MHAPRSKTVGAYEAKTNLPALLREVAAGREIIITRREKPIAKLVPIAPVHSDKEIFDRIRAFHGKIKLPKGETGIDLIRAGRRM